MSSKDPKTIQDIDAFFTGKEAPYKQKARKNREAYTSSVYDAVSRNTQSQRELNEEARTVALNRNLELFEPLRQMLVRMYGPEFEIPIDQFRMSPLEEAKFGTEGEQGAARGSATQGAFSTQDDPLLSQFNPNDQSTWYDTFKDAGGSYPDTSHGTGFHPAIPTSPNTLGVGPQAPADAGEICRTCGYGPNAIWHKDQSMPNFHQYVRNGGR